MPGRAHVSTFPSYLHTSTDPSASLEIADAVQHRANNQRKRHYRVIKYFCEAPILIGEDD